MIPSYIDPQELIAYFSGMKAGDLVTKQGLEEIFSAFSRRDYRELTSELVNSGVLVAEPSGYRFTGAGFIGKTRLLQGEYSPKKRHTNHSNASLNYKDIMPMLSPIAYELFDPNPVVYRGIVIDGRRFDHYKGKMLPPAVKVLKDGKAVFGIVSPRWDTPGRRISEKIAKVMKSGEIVLLRHVGIQPSVRGEEIMCFEPLLSIGQSDNIALNSIPISTRKYRDIIEHMPLVEAFENSQDAVGYLQSGGEPKPVIVENASQYVWKIPALLDRVSEEKYRILEP